MKHSELPWVYDEDFDLIDSKDESIVCDFVGDSFYNSKNNAEFIIKACNEYYPMIKIIKVLIEKLDDDVWMLELSNNEIICVESIKNIVKQTETEK